MKLFIDLFGISNYLFIANLLSLLSSFLELSIKLLFKLRFLDFDRATTRSEGASLLILNLILMSNLTAKHFPCDSEPLRSILV
jgi:hypothetical protein